MKALVSALLFAIVTLALRAQPASSPDPTLPHGVAWSEGVTYTYDGAGNIKRIGTDVQVYDAVGRLIRSDTDGTRRNYRYDAFGNRLACTDANGSDCQYGRQVTSTRNQFSAATYDPVGNLTNFDGHTYSYDAFNMQTRDQVDGTAAVREYIYTANDERIAVYVPGTGSWQWSLRDASGKVLREMTSSDPPAGTGTVGTAAWNWTKDYVYREGLLVASRQLEPGATTPTTYHYHLDHLGTPRQITDDSGRIVGAHSYHAFGPELTDGRKDEPSPTRLKYTSHEHDPELDYMHARYYDSKMGRFLSVDPHLDIKENLREPQRWNRYAYVTNNPLRYTDPDGRDRYHEPGFTKPYSEWGEALQMDESTPTVIKVANYAAGGLTALGAAGFMGAGSGLTSIARSATALASRLTTSATAAEMTRRVVGDSNRMNHIFGNPGHKLDGLVRAFGSADKVVSAVSRAVLSVGNLQTNANGVFSVVVKIGGQNVEVRGRVLKDAIRVADFWVK